MGAEYLTIGQVAGAASMSVRTLRKYLSEIPHYRPASKGRILIRRADFDRWMESRRVEVKRDDDVMALLRGLAETTR
jgi:hypothetical protein